jgi:hypothetical protein
MNALEEPLGAMARFLDRRFEVATWGTVINAIKSKIDQISRTGTRGRAKTKILETYGEAAQEFAYFNEAWRIRVMHGRASYDVHNARSIFNHVEHFVERLSTAGLSTRSRKKFRL